MSTVLERPIQNKPALPLLPDGRVSVYQRNSPVSTVVAAGGPGLLSVRRGR